MDERNKGRPRTASEGSSRPASRPATWSVACSAGRSFFRPTDDRRPMVVSGHRPRPSSVRTSGTNSGWALAAAIVVECCVRAPAERCSSNIRIPEGRSGKTKRIAPAAT